MTGMGSSAGRSEGNRTAKDAERRATQRERDGIDPPFPVEDKGSSYRLTERGERWLENLLSFVAISSWVAFCCLGAIIIAAWWGLL